MEKRNQKIKLKQQKNESGEESESESEDEEVEENNEKVAVTLENTETAVEDESRKEENLRNDISLSIVENLKGPKDNNSLDIEKTEIINEIIKENEIEAVTREVPIVNNIEIIPTVAEDIKFQISDQINSSENVKEVSEVPKVPEGILIEPIMETEISEKEEKENILNEKVKEFEVSTKQSKDLVSLVEGAIEAPEKLVAIVEDIIIPNKESDKIIENPEKVDITVDDSSETIEESSIVVDEISEEIIEPSAEIIEENAENETAVADGNNENNEVKEIVEPIVEQIIESSLETLTKESIPEVIKATPETIVEPEVTKQEIVEATSETVVEPEVTKQEIVEATPETVVEPEVTKQEIVETIPEAIVEPEVTKQEVIESTPETVTEPEVTKQETVEVTSETVVEPEVTKQEIVEATPETVVEPEVTKQETVEVTPESVAEPEVTKQETVEVIPETIVESEVIKPESTSGQEIEVMEEVIKLPVQTSEELSEPQIMEVTEEIIEVPAEDNDEIPPYVEEKSSADQQPENIESLISEIEKVVNDTDSDGSFIQENEKEEIAKSKPVNAADIVGHEEIIYEDNVDGDDDGEWIDEDDDGEWVDEDEDEEVEEEKPEVKEVKPEVKRQSLMLNTQLDFKRQSLLLNNTPIDILSSLKTPMSTTSSTFKIQTPISVSKEEKPKVLPDAILDRIFREVDPQTMWVLRNTSIKTRNIVDNILKETFEQFDLSMDPLYFDVTSKDNLGLVLNSLDLSPFALAMLLHEILKLDSLHIGYAFGQMFRVPSKIDVDYLTELIVDTLNILKTKKDIDIASVMHGLQHYYCFNHSELEFYQLFDLIEMSPEEVARFIQNHYHFILSKSLPPLLQALDVDEVFVAEMCKAYANDDMDAFARIISKVPVRYVRTSIHPGDVKGDRVVVVNENGEDVIVVLNDNERRDQSHNNGHDHGKGPADEEEWFEDDDEEDEDIDENEGNGDNMIIVENNESFSLFVGRVLRFLNMNTKDVASFLKYLPEYCSYDEDEILEGLNWNEDQIIEMRKIMKEEQDKIAKKMKELSKLIIQRRMSISNGLGSPSISSPSRQFY